MKRSVLLNGLSGGQTCKAVAFEDKEHTLPTLAHNLGYKKVARRHIVCVPPRKTLTMTEPKKLYIPESENFPGSALPVLLFENILELPRFFSGVAVRRLFHKNGWGNNWRAGIFTYHHYHSSTHEVLGIIEGRAELQLGGNHGPKITVRKFDVLIIPAGVAHKNLGHEKDVDCIGGYPEGRNYDILHGAPGDRQIAMKNLPLVPFPKTDPVTGGDEGVPALWRGGVGF